MKIYVKNDDGKMYEAFQVDKNTYTFKTENNKGHRDRYLVPPFFYN